MADEGTARIAAPAKVNLGLSVTTRRGDGFHEIETIMARLDLADEIEVRLVKTGGAPGMRVALTIGGPEAETADLPTDDRNLVVQAATAYLRLVDPQWLQDASVHVALTKRVPIAAGLGGGSSDAAATLIALSRLLPATVDLARLAADLGSDVPFFLSPWPAALARGRGERLSHVEVPGLSLVLAKPPFGLAAAEAYATLAGFTPRLRHAAIVAALRAGEDPGWRNALQPGVIRNHPEVRHVITTLKSAGLTACIMSGSGPTCFGLATSRAEAEDVARSVSAAQPTWRVVAASTCQA